MPFQVLCPLWIRLFLLLLLLLLSCRSYSYILNSNPFSDLWFINIFSHSIYCICWCVWCMSLKKFFFLWNPTYLFFPLLCSFGVISKKSLQILCLDAFPLFSSKSFIVLALLHLGFWWFFFWQYSYCFYWQVAFWRFFLCHSHLSHLQYFFLLSFFFPFVGWIDFSLTDFKVIHLILLFYFPGILLLIFSDLYINL